MGTSGKEILWNGDGTLYHLGVKQGDVFPRIVQVGSYERAALIASNLEDTRVFKSNRGFHVYSGKFNGKGVSVAATGMGAPMMDFFVREISAIVPGKLAIVRLGTCGAFGPTVPAGSAIVVQNCAYVYRNYAHFDGGSLNWPEAAAGPPYIISAMVPSDKALSEALYKNITDSAEGKFGSFKLNGASGESFYSTQGRLLDHFDDKNSDLVENLKKLEIGCIEMETHQLLHLAKQRSVKCHAAGVQIVVLNRMHKEAPNVTVAQLTEAESVTGRAALATLASFNLD